VRVEQILSGGVSPLFLFAVSMANSSVMQDLWGLIDPLAREEGLELLEIELRSEPRVGRVLRVYLDRRDKCDDNEGPDIDELSRVSRQLSDLLDVYDVVPGAYTLEVSSPGVDRPLRKPEHFARYIGKCIRVRTAETIAGRKKFSGVLRGSTSKGVTVFEDGREVFIPFELIRRANYVHDWASSG
jgi:ribosome maturation factor RimP